MADQRIGSMYWLLSLKGTFEKDIAAVKAEVEGLKTKIKDTEKDTKKFGDTTATTAKEIRMMGAGIAAAGGALIMVGMAAQAAGGDMAALSKPLIVVGSSMAAIGGITATVFPLMRAYAAFQASQLVMSIKAATVAIWAQHAALTALGAATGIGLAIAGLYLLYKAMEAASAGAKELERHLQMLGHELDDLKQIQASYNDQASRSKDSYNKLTDAVKDYQTAVRDATRDVERLHDIERDLIGLSLDFEEAKLDEAAAIREWQKAVASGGDQEKLTRAAIAAGKASERRKKLEEDITNTLKEQSELSTAPDKLSELEAGQAAAIKAKADAEKEHLRILEEEEKINERIRIGEFQMYLLRRQEAGLALTKEDMEAFGGVNAPTWMKTALASMPQTVTQTPDYLGTLAAFLKPAPMEGLKSGVGSILGGSLQTREVTNPLFRDIVIQVNGTISNQTIRVPASQIAQSAAARGYQGVG